MAKSDLEAQRKSSLSDCTWLENEFGSFNLEALKFLMHFREAGSLFYLYSYSHFFFSYIFFRYYFFLLSLSFSFFLFLSHQFFYLLPFDSKITLYLPPPLCFRRLLVLGQRGDKDKVGKGNTFPLPWHRLAIFLELMIHPQQ
jgi:hypothetical protein